MLIMCQVLSALIKSCNSHSKKKKCKENQKAQDSDDKNKEQIIQINY